MEKTHKKINDSLVALINKIWAEEASALIIEEFKDLTINDMHVIEAVGLGGQSNMSAIAKRLNITIGSLTTSMNSLVKKAYVERKRSEEDRRVVYITLTEKGERAYRHHENYHRQMTDKILSGLSKEEFPLFIKMLDTLTGFFAC